MCMKIITMTFSNAFQVSLLIFYSTSRTPSPHQFISLWAMANNNYLSPRAFTRG